MLYGLTRGELSSSGLAGERSGKQAARNFEYGTFCPREAIGILIIGNDRRQGQLSKYDVNKATRHTKSATWLQILSQAAQAQCVSFILRNLKWP